jgi:hypothetical protein
LSDEYYPFLQQKYSLSNEEIESTATISTINKLAQLNLLSEQDGEYQILDNIQFTLLKGHIDDPFDKKVVEI